MFMIRLKLPGGKLTAEQYLALDDIADRYANGTLRFTTRQSIQFHGVLKSNLKATIGNINDALVSTLGACGDVNRNVVTCPAPTGDPVRGQMQLLADAIAEHLAPQGGAYHEVWLNGERIGEPEAIAEPIYGKVYLPRKFKTGFALPDDNCTDLLAQCLGFLAVVQDGQPVGYDLYAGGGQGMTHSKPDTYPCLAKPIGFVEPHDVVEAAEAIVRLFRDHGNRSDRKRARLKYLVHDWGVEKFRRVFETEYWGRPLDRPHGLSITGLDLHHGWVSQRDGRWFLGISVENGRVKDEGTYRLRSGLRALVERFHPVVRVSTQQDVLLGDLATSDRHTVDALLAEFGIPRPESLPLVQKWSMACPAIPTCGLAITESERFLPSLIDQLEGVLADLGLSGEPISVRMTGCPNGCARPYQSEIGIVGRSGNKYTVYVGGDRLGRRLNSELQDLVPQDQLIPRLTIILRTFREERTVGEHFGDYCTRVGIDRLRKLVGAAP
jgi:sulfite reductase (ferredoxin)